jgi:hypothetical protein
MTVKVKYTKELLEPLVKESISYREVTRKLGLNEGSKCRVRDKIKQFGIDDSHFLGHTWSRGKSKKNCEAVLKQSLKRTPTEASKTADTRINKRRLLDSGIKYICSNCDINEWMGESLILDIDHSNGDRTNNELSNLRFLCPNCHRLQKTRFAPSKIKWPDCEHIVQLVKDNGWRKTSEMLGVTRSAIYHHLRDRNVDV